MLTLQLFHLFLFRYSIIDTVAQTASETNQQNIAKIALVHTGHITRSHSCTNKA